MGGNNWRALDHCNVTGSNSDGVQQNGVQSVSNSSNLMNGSL